MNERLRVAVLMGGWSSQREASLNSGNAVADLIRKLNYDIVTVDPVQDLVRFAAQLSSTRAAVIFNALPGMKGMIQGALDIAGIPYTHSGLRASAIAADNALTHLVAKNAGISVAASKGEYAVSVIDKGDGPEILGITPQLADDVAAQMTQAAVLIHKTLGCADISCSYFGDDASFVRIDTHPDLTALPMKDLALESLVVTIINAALKRFAAQ